MKTKWPRMKLGEVLIPVERGEAPMPGKIYRQIGVKLWGEGCYERETIDGAETKYGRLFRAEAGDVIVNKIWARNGSVAVVTEELNGCYGSAEFPMFKAVPHQLASRWMHWFTKTSNFWKQCDEKSQGTSGKNRIRPERFLEIQLSLPPLAEQRRIAAKIDQLAAKIVEARTLCHKGTQETEALEVISVSSWCFGNRTTRNFGEYLLEAKNGIYKPSIFWGRGLPCVRMYNIEGPRLNQKNLQLLDVSQEELEIYGCKPGDLIFNRVNSAELVGKTGLVTTEFPQCTFESKNMRLRVDPSRVLPEFAALVLNSAQIHSYYRQVLKQQCGMATLNQGHVRGIPFPDIALVEQRQIVAEVDALQAEMDALTPLQAETASDLNALLPSILDRAFKGEL